MKTKTKNKQNKETRKERQKGFACLTSINQRVGKYLLTGDILQFSSKANRTSLAYCQPNYLHFQ